MSNQDLYAKYGPKLHTLCQAQGEGRCRTDNRLISPSYTRSYPLVAKRGFGVRVEDVDGNEFLDSRRALP